MKIELDFKPPYKFTTKTDKPLPIRIFDEDSAKITLKIELSLPEAENLNSELFNLIELQKEHIELEKKKQ